MVVEKQEGIPFNLDKAIIFLLYDSRSGSTFFSRILTENLRGTRVTQEIGFEEILKQQDTTNKKIWLNVIDRTERNNDLRNCDIDLGRIKKIIQSSRKISKEIVFNLILSQVLGQYSEKNIIIKNGRHVKYLEELASLIRQDMKILYIYRDPRAVINSKLKTSRPYYPKEVMAWGGVLIAGLQWNHYTKLINKYNKIDRLAVYKVSYEELITQQMNILKNTASFLGIQVKKTSSGKGYVIPENEGEIHRLVDQKPNKKRLLGWKQELSKSKLKKIECVTGKYMEQLRYERTQLSSRSSCFLIILISIPEVVFNILRHYVYHLMRRFTK